jgi:hypothetical protein
MGLYKASSKEFQMFIADRFNLQEVTIFAAPQPFTFFLYSQSRMLFSGVQACSLPQYDDEVKSYCLAENRIPSTHPTCRH